MKRGFRLCLVGGLCLFLSKDLALHPDGIALGWKLLCDYEKRGCWELLLVGLAELLEVAAVAGSMWILGMELAAYYRWKRGRTTPQDAAREVWWEPYTNLDELIWELAYDGREAWARAKRRWPRKKGELAKWLAQKWTRTMWAAVGLVAGGEALMAFLSYRIPGYILTPGQSLGAALIGLVVGNALVLLAWVAGDDDEGGHRSFPSPPRPPRGHKHPKRVRMSLRVQRSDTTRVPQTRAGK